MGGFFSKRSLIEGDQSGRAEEMAMTGLEDISDTTLDDGDVSMCEKDNPECPIPSLSQVRKLFSVLAPYVTSWRVWRRR